MSIVLLVGAGLLIRSLWQLQQVEPRLRRRARCWRWKCRCRRRATRKASRCRSTSGSKSASRALPGVAAVGAINILPLSNNYDSRGVQVEDHPRPEGQGYVAAGAIGRRRATSRAMGIPLIAGRDFDAHDVDERPARR